MPKRLFGLSIAVVLLLAVALRLFRLGKAPVSLYWDEVAMLVDAKSIAQTGKDMHGNFWLQAIFPSYGDYKLPVYIWSASLMVKIFGVNNWVLRLPSALAGILTVAVSGWLAVKIWQITKKPSDLKLRPVLLFTILIAAVSPWAVMFSRTGFEGHLAQFLVACSAVILLWRPDKVWSGVLAAVFGGLATYTYFSVRFVWPIIYLTLVWLVNLSWLKGNLTKLLVRDGPTIKLGLRKLATQVVLPLGLFGLLLIPMFNSPLYAASNQFRLSTESILNNQNYALESNQLRKLAGENWYDGLLFHRHFLLAREFIRNLFDHLSLNFLYLTGDSNLRHGTGIHGLFLLSFLPTLFSGLYYLFDKNKPVLAVLLIWWLAALIPASVPEETPHALRSLNALIPLVIIQGYGLTFLVKLLKKNRLRQIILTGYLTLIVLNVFQFVNHYFNYYPQVSASYWQAGYQQLASTIEANRDPVRTVWVNEFDDRFYLWLMAYGPYSGEDFQSWISQNYQFTQIENIEFRSFDWSKLASLDHRLLVVGESAKIDQQLSQIDYPPAWSRQINQGSMGKQFTVLEFRP